MRLLPILLFALLPTPVAARATITSPGPDTTSVTVYRDPDRGEGAIDAYLPGGFALISETRRIALPAGETTIRFEGVADGIIAVSAVVTGLPGGVAQKNRDARLLSPAALLDGTLGNRVHLRRTVRATGKVTEQDAIIRSGADNAVLLQTGEGFEGLRCAGLPENLSYDGVPSGLTAKPTLSILTTSPSAVTADVTLTYLATGFDWGASYVAKVAQDGRTLDLFAWLTVANGGDTGFSDSELLAVAGKLNRVSDYDVLVGRAPSPELALQCWPMDTTSTPGAPPRPPPPPLRMMAAPMAMEGAMQDIVVSARRVADQEELGDLKLYRVPMRVDVNPHGQKQVALLQKGSVPFHLYYAARIWPLRGADASRPMSRMIRMQNKARDGLGLPLPSGGVALFQQSGSESLLVGDGRLRDHAVGEDVEFGAGESAQVRVSQTGQVDADESGRVFRVELTNALDRPAVAEIRINSADGYALLQPSIRLEKRDRDWLWIVTVAANSKAELRYRMKEE
jgi:hypothetical protein